MLNSLVSTFKKAIDGVAGVMTAGGWFFPVFLMASAAMDPTGSLLTTGWKFLSPVFDAHTWTVGAPALGGQLWDVGAGIFHGIDSAIPAGTFSNLFPA